MQLRPEVVLAMAHSAAKGLLIIAGICFAASISLTLAGHPEPAKILATYPPTLVACAVFAVVAEPKLQ